MNGFEGLEPCPVPYCKSKVHHYHRLLDLQDSIDHGGPLEPRTYNCSYPNGNFTQCYGPALEEVKKVNESKKTDDNILQDFCPEHCENLDKDDELG